MEIHVYGNLYELSFMKLSILSHIVPGILDAHIQAAGQ